MSTPNKGNIISNQEIQKLLPEHMIIYPKFEEEEKSLKKMFKSQKMFFGNNNEEEEDPEKYEINENFLNLLIRKPCPLSKTQITNVLSKKIQSSSLFQKLINEYHSEKKINVANLCNAFVHKLNYSFLEQNEVLYKVGDNDNRLFFILSGRIQLLKLKELPNVQMTNLEYLNYCKYLYKNNEMYILNEVINYNHRILPFMSEEEVMFVSKIYFQLELMDKINRHTLKNNFFLNKFFNSYEYTYKDFGIKTKDLNNIEDKKIKKLIGANEEWENYIKEKCSPTDSDLSSYEPFKILLKSKQIKNVTCFVYESDSYLEQNEYFGEISYDSYTKQNKYAVRAQKDSVLAWIKNADYLNVIDPKRKLETIKEILYLNKAFFFKEINGHLFEKNVYPHFLLHEFTRNTVLCNSGEKPKNLLFLREGKLSLEIKCSIIDFSYLIKDLYNNLVDNPLFKDISPEIKKMILSKETTNILKRIAYDDSLDKILKENPHTIEEFKKNKKFNISQLNSDEILGIEEYFLNCNYISKCTVNARRALCYSIPVKEITHILKEDHKVLISFVKTATNKIISLIKRLDNIKSHSMSYIKTKFDYELKMNQNAVTEGNEVNYSKKNLNEYINTINSSILNTSYNYYKLKTNTLYDNYTKNNIIKNTETIDLFNNSKNKLSFEKYDMSLNTNNSFSSYYCSKSPTIKSLFSNNNKLTQRTLNKKSNMSHSNTKNYLLNDPILSRPNLFKTKNMKSNDIYLSLRKEEETKDLLRRRNQQLIKKRINNKMNGDSENRKVLLVGKNKINIENLKKNIDEFVSCDNSNKYVEVMQSNRISHNYTNNFYNHNLPQNASIDRINFFHKKRFHLSLVPMNKLNIYTDNNKTLEKSGTNLNNDYKIKQINSLTDFIGVNSNDNYIPPRKNASNGLLPKLDLKISKIKKKIHSLNKEKINKLTNGNLLQNNKFKNSFRREDVKDSIKEYYNDIKKKGCLSFIPNKVVNTIFMRKFHKKYQDALKSKKI